MNITVKLFATLRDYTPAGTEKGAKFLLQIPSSDSFSLQDLVTHLNLPHREVKLALVNGSVIQDFSSELHEGDLVVLSPAVIGG